MNFRILTQQNIQVCLDKLSRFTSKPINVKKSLKNIIKKLVNEDCCLSVYQKYKDTICCWHSLKKHKTLTQKFSKLVLHVQKHTGRAVKTWHVYAPNVVGSVEKCDGLSRQTWMFYVWKNAGKSWPLTIARKCMVVKCKHSVNLGEIERTDT